LASKEQLELETPETVTFVKQFTKMHHFYTVCVLIVVILIMPKFPNRRCRQVAITGSRLK
jgi:hypothetical protein